MGWGGVGGGEKEKEGMRRKGGMGEGERSRGDEKGGRGGGREACSGGFRERKLTNSDLTGERRRRAEEGGGVASGIPAGQETQVALEVAPTAAARSARTFPVPGQQTAAPTSAVARVVVLHGGAVVGEVVLVRKSDRQHPRRRVLR